MKYCYKFKLNWIFRSQIKLIEMLNLLLFTFFRQSSPDLQTDIVQKRNVQTETYVPFGSVDWSPRWQSGGQRFDSHWRKDFFLIFILLFLQLNKILAVLIASFHEILSESNAKCPSFVANAFKQTSDFIFSHRRLNINVYNNWSLELRGVCLEIRIDFHSSFFYFRTITSTNWDHR